jgi:23S rRNA (adenine2503-C2)-methyltransferase
LQGLVARLPEVSERHTSTDGSTKVVVRFGDDRVEAVHMPRNVGTGRVTLCVSSQVGCAMGCGFCATARMGFGRHLSAGEIVGQVLAVTAALGPRHPGELTLVFMGMGEPLHNLPEVARAIAVLCEPRGLGLSSRRITVSTSGLVPEIDALAGLAVRPLLALSLNATTDETRSRLMPIARRYPLTELRAALTRYPVRARERITIEYVLLAGVNDTPADAERLAAFCAPFPHQLNLIPWNAHAGADFRAPSEPELDRFARALLAKTRAVVTVRRSRGRDVGAACGQLIRARTPTAGAVRPSR